MTTKIDEKDDIAAVQPTVIEVFIKTNNVIIHNDVNEQCQQEY